MKVKLFAVAAGYVDSVFGAADKIESTINAWLEQQEGNRIVDIRQSSNGGGLEPSQNVISACMRVQATGFVSA
jgi:hypothetical protein